MKTFFIGDTHFGGFGNGINIPPQKAIPDLITNWNSTVSEYDEVYHLGDVANEKFNINDITNIINKLNGKKYLVMGNHDRHLSISTWENCGFEKVYDHPIILLNFVIVCHEPLFINPYMPYMMAYAHVHDNPIYIDETINTKCFSIQRIGFKPSEWDAYNKLKK